MAYYGRYVRPPPGARALFAFQGRGAVHTQGGALTAARRSVGEGAMGRVWIVVAALAASGAATAARDGVRSAVRPGAPPVPPWQTFGDGGAVKSESEGLRLRVPAGGHAGPVGVELDAGVRGDFEVLAAYSGLACDVPSGGYGAGIGLEIEADHDGPLGLTVERLVLPDEGDRFTSTLVALDDDGARRYSPVRADASGPAGVLGLRRRGPTAEAFVRSPDGAEAVLRGVELGRGDLTRLRLSCYSGHSNAGVSVLVTGLTVRAEGFPPPRAAPAAPPLSRAARRRLLSAGLAALCALAGLAGWHAPRLAAPFRRRLSVSLGEPAGPGRAGEDLEHPAATRPRPALTDRNDPT